MILKAPAHNPNGPDGKGWNRLAITMAPQDECALRPATFAAFVESWHTTARASYGHYGHCIANGACGSCRFAKARESGSSEVFVRVDESGRPWVMNKPADGWASFGLVVSWEYLATIRAASMEVFTDSESKCVVLK